jgi:hypothetical protein
MRRKWRKEVIRGMKLPEGGEMKSEEDNKSLKGEMITQ